jgi:divalent metal cation (Fe/Co/Zn/Cd) transporter
MSYIILAISIVIEGAVCYLAFKEFNLVRGNKGCFQAVRDGKDPVLFVVLFEDLAAMLGLVVAFVGILLSQYTKNSIYDGISAVIIGLILAFVAIWLAIETKGLLIGESASKDTCASIKKEVDIVPEVDYVNEVVTNHFGPNYILVLISLDFNDGLNAGELENIIDDITNKVKSIDTNIKRVFVEVRKKT